MGRERDARDLEHDPLPCRIYAGRGSRRCSSSRATRIARSATGTRREVPGAGTHHSAHDPRPGLRFRHVAALGSESKPMTTMKIRILVGDALVGCGTCRMSPCSAWSRRRPTGDCATMATPSGKVAIRNANTRGNGPSAAARIRPYHRSRTAIPGRKVRDRRLREVRSQEGGRRAGDDRITSDWSESVQGMTIEPEPEPEPEPEVETPPVQKFSVAAISERLAGRRVSASAAGPIRTRGTPRRFGRTALKAAGWIGTRTGTPAKKSAELRPAAAANACGHFSRMVNI